MKSRYVFIIFGLLDLFSFYHTYSLGWSLIIYRGQWSIFTILEILLIVSFLFSGVLLIANQTAGRFLYYFQFLLRLGFTMPTFGFLLTIPGVPINSLIRKIVVGIVIGLEMLRLFYTVRKHRG